MFSKEKRSLDLFIFIYLHFLKSFFVCIGFDQTMNAAAPPHRTYSVSNTLASQLELQLGEKLD